MKKFLPSGLKTLISMLLFFVLAVSQKSFGQTASATWPLTSNGTAAIVGNVTGGTASATGVTGAGFTAGTGLSATGWTTNNAVNTGEYFQYSMAPTAGNTLTVTSLSFTPNSNTTGTLKYQAVYFVTNTALPSNPTFYSSSTLLGNGTVTSGSSGAMVSINGLNVSVPSGSTMYVRIYAYDVVSSGTSFGNKNTVLSGTSAAPPTISTTGVSPVCATIGTSIAVTGTNLLGASNVKFNGGAVSATPTGVTATSFNVVVPTGASAGTITVTTPGGTATSAQSIAIIAITNYGSTCATIGQAVQINGTGFTGVVAANVKFNGQAATTITVNSDNQITATVPTGATTGAVTIVSSCGATATGASLTVGPVVSAGAPSSSPTVCAGTALPAAITISTTGATGIGTPTGLPTGVTAVWSAGVITINGTPAAVGTYNYTIPLTGGCSVVNATGSITVNTNTAAAPSANPTLCINTTLSPNVTIATTGATGISNDGVGGANGLPTGMSATWASNVITISGIPSVSGTFTYNIPLTGGCGNGIATGTITVNANNTAGAPSATPTLCINTALSPNVTISTTGATGISGDNVTTGVNGLPAGMKAHWAANVITISGTPTASGTFNYSILLTGGCSAVSATGAITVTPANTASAPSSNPSLCANTTLPNITISTTGATGIGAATGLPAGVSAAWSAGVITISGTPSATGTFNYSIPLTGGCSNVSATGTITVNSNTAAAPSSNPNVCINTAMTNVTIATTGATGIGAATGLPAGVSASWASNVITISGTPTATGTFTYSIPLTGGCGNVSAGGTITVNNLPTFTGTLVACVGGTSILTGSGTGATTNPWVSSNTGVATITASTTPGSSGPLNPGTGADVDLSGNGSWANPGNVAAAGVSTISLFFASSDYLVATNYGFNIPANATIGTITVAINRNEPDGNNAVVDNSIKLYSGGVIGTSIAHATAWPDALTVDTYTGNVSAFWGAGTLTPANINSANFGAAVSVKNSNFSTRNAAVDYIQITITYTTPDAGMVTVTGVSAGTTNITYTNSSGCQVTQAFTVNATPVVSLNSPTACAGTPVTLTAVPTTGLATDYSYAWTVPSGTNPGNVSSFSTTIAGLYSVVITNIATGCVSSSASGTVTMNALPSVTVNSPTVCAGSNATVTATVTVTTGPYSYAWTVPAGATAPGNVSSFNTTVAGAYSVIVTKTSTGCASTSASGTVTLNPVATLTSTGGASTQSICSGNPITTISYTIGGSGTGATVSITPTGSGLTGSVSGNTVTISGTPTGSSTFTITTTGGSCPATTSGAITLNQSPTPIVITPAAPVVCNGSNVQLIATGGGGVTYSILDSSAFEGDGSANRLLSNGSAVDRWFTNSSGTQANGQNYWTISYQTSCEITGNHSLEIFRATNNYCTYNTAAATNTYVYRSFSSAGYANLQLTFNYKVGGEGGGAGAGSDYGTVTYSTDGTTWTDLPTHYSNQTTVTSATVTFPSNVLDNKGTVYYGFRWTSNTSAGSGNGFIVDDVYMRGTNITSKNITWAPATNLAVSVTGDTVTASPAATTKYFATSTVNGCSAVDSVTVTVNPAMPTVSAQSVTICGSGALSFAPAGMPSGFSSTGAATGTTYSWGTPVYNNISGSGAAGTNQTSITDNLTNSGTSVGTATYTVTPSFNGACSGAPFTLTVTVNPTIPSLSAQTAPAICNGSAFSYTPAGMPSGITYTWAAPSYSGSVTGGVSGSSQNTITGAGTLVNSGTSPGTATYTVTPSFSGGCTGTAFTVTVTVNPTANASFDYGTTPTSTFCATGTASVAHFTGTSGGTYTASGSLGINSTTGAIDLTTGVGDYTITYTIAATGGCSAFTTTASIHINPAPAFIGFNSSGTIPYCNYSDGSGGFEIVTNTDPAHGSQVGVNYQLMLNGSPVSAGLLAGNGTSLDFGYFTAGAYTIVATNTTTGCTATVTATLTLVPVNPPNTYNLTVNGVTGVISTTVCAGSQGNNANSLIIGLDQTDPATPYRLYLNGIAIGSSITGNGSPISFPAVSASGNYTVHAVTTSCGNLLMNGQVSVTVSPLPLAPDLTVADPSCSVSTGTITVNSPATTLYSLDGGTPVAQTSFTVPAGDPTTGTTHTVAAFNGTCYGSVTTVTIHGQPPTPVAPTLTVTQADCTLPTLGKITVTAPLGVQYHYSIDGTDYSNTSGIFNVAPGTYSVTIKQSGICVGAATVAVINPLATKPNDPTALVLTPGSASISGTFTAPTPAPTNYLVIRTLSSTGPSTPVSGTTYTAGTTALGGFIAAITTGTSFIDNAVVPGTTYYYWVYAYNAGSCTQYSTGNANANATPNSCSSTTTLYWAGLGSTITGNTDISTNAQFNNAINWSISNSGYSVSASAPTACTDIVMNLSTATDQIIPLSAAIVANSLTINLSGTAKNTIDAGPYVLTLLKTAASGGNGLAISAGSSSSSKAYLTTEGGSIRIYGNAAIGDAADAGYSYIGNGDGTTTGGTISFRGNTTFEKNSAVSNGGFVSTTFDASGAQVLTNNTNSSDANVGANAVAFQNIRIGNINTPSVTLAGTSTGIEYVNGGNLTISANTSLNIPAGYGINQLGSTVGTVTLGANATLRVGGTASGTHPATGSNFPGGFATYAFDCTSTTEYYGATQTVFSTSYGNLTLTSAGVKTAGGNLNICSNVLINTATFVGGAFSHTVGGNWTNNGAFTPSTSTVAFIGTASAQTIGGTVSTTFGGLTINNSQGVTIVDAANPNVNKNVNGLLTLTSGLLTTDQNDLLILGSAASTNVAAPDVVNNPNYYQSTSYVNGPLQKIGNTDFTFPVGKASSVSGVTGYEPITISAASDNSVQTYTAEYIRESAMTLGPIGPSNPQLVHVSGCDYWRLDNGSDYPSNTNTNRTLAGGATANLIMYWSPNNALACNSTYVTNLSTLAIGHLGFVSGQSYAGLWTPIGVGAYSRTGTATSGSISYVGVSTFSPFSLATLDGTDNPLPIKLDYFDAVKSTGFNKLTWKAECTSASAGFEVERSSDGISFTGIHYVAVNNATDCSVPFEYDDYTSTGSKVYYRIKMIDIDGNMSNSEIKLILNDANTVQIMSMRPNPLQSEGWLDVSASQSNKIELVILTIDGREVVRKTVQLQPGSNTVNMNTASLAKGMYIVRGIFNNGGQTNVVPFIKQ